MVNTQKIFGIIEDTAWSRAIITFVGIVLLALVIVLIVVLVKKGKNKKKDSNKNGEILQNKNDPFSIKQPEVELKKEENTTLNEVKPVSLSNQEVVNSDSVNVNTEIGTNIPVSEVSINNDSKYNSDTSRDNLDKLNAITPINDNASNNEVEVSSELSPIVKEENKIDNLDNFRIKSVESDPFNSNMEENDKTNFNDILPQSNIEKVEALDDNDKTVDNAIVVDVLPNQENINKIDNDINANDDDEKVLVTKEEEMSIMNPYQKDNDLNSSTSEEIPMVENNDIVKSAATVIPTNMDVVENKPQESVNDNQATSPDSNKLGATEKFCANCGNREVTLGDVCSNCGAKF